MKQLTYWEGCVIAAKEGKEARVKLIFKPSTKESDPPVDKEMIIKKDWGYIVEVIRDPFNDNDEALNRLLYSTLRDLIREDPYDDEHKKEMHKFSLALKYLKGKRQPNTKKTIIERDIVEWKICNGIIADKKTNMDERHRRRILEAYNRTYERFKAVFGEDIETFLEFLNFCKDVVDKNAALKDYKNFHFSKGKVKGSKIKCPF